jgi:hypothetical protein
MRGSAMTIGLRAASDRCTGRRLALAALLVVLSLGVAPAPAQQAASAELPSETAPVSANPYEELRSAAVRIPLAAVLGTALALRPGGRGTPLRRTPVVQTQIVLAIVGAIVMLIVGVSLARAFGIVGMASLIRYRTKINNPKDAVVMLSALAVGLASGAGLYALALFSTLFLVAALLVIESFEPQTRSFELSVKHENDTMELRPKIEASLRRMKVKYELRSVSDGEVSYYVTAPAALRTDKASKALTALLPDGKGAVEWNEVSKSKSI